MAKKTMTLNLSEEEMAALERLCEKKDLSKTAVVRQALRLYQRVFRSGSKRAISCFSSSQASKRESRGHDAMSS